MLLDIALILGHCMEISDMDKIEHSNGTKSHKIQVLMGEMRYYPLVI